MKHQKTLINTVRAISSVLFFLSGQNKEVGIILLER